MNVLLEIKLIKLLVFSFLLRNAITNATRFLSSSEPPGKDDDDHRSFLCFFFSLTQLILTRMDLHRTGTLRIFLLYSIVPVPEGCFFVKREGVFSPPRDDATVRYMQKKYRAKQVRYAASPFL